MNNLYSGYSIVAFYQVSVHLVKWFQRRRFLEIDQSETRIASLARGPHLPAKIIFTMDFCLCGAILNLKAFCFGAIPDIMIEMIANRH
jgi:hypothetical protein